MIYDIKKKEEAIDMLKYINSGPIHEKCLGCNRVFDFVHPGTETTEAEKRCLAYARPAMWWEDKPTATKMGMVKDPKTAVSSLKEVPVIQRMCPLASHTKHANKEDNGKARVGQQKQKRKDK